MFISSNHTMSTSKFPMLSHVSSRVWLPEAISRLLSFRKKMRLCCSSFGVLIISPKDVLRCLPLLEHKKESSSWVETEWLLGKLTFVWDMIFGVGGGVSEWLRGVVIIGWHWDGERWGEITGSVVVLINRIWLTRL